MNNYNKFPKPPRIAEWLIKKFFPDKGDFTTIGDLEEVFHYMVESENNFHAKWWYRREAIKSIFYFMVHIIDWSIGMFNNYIKLAWRNLIKHKMHSIINLTGLTFGIAASFIFLLFTIDELSFDKFHNNYDNIARLINEEFVESGENQFYPLTTFMAGKTLKHSYPEIMSYVNIIDNSTFGRPVFSYKESQFIEADYLFTTAEFFDVFDFELITGTSKDLLNQPNQMILTESTAIKYLGDEDPIGKIIRSDRQGLDFTITGIMKDPPDNSHLQFSMLISAATLSASPRFKQVMDNWDRSSVKTYLLFKDNESLASFNPKLESFVENHKTNIFGTTETLHLQPLEDIHFSSGHMQFDRNYGARSITTIYVLAVIGLFILLSACINYSNLSIARYMNRAKEFGMRKVVGASKGQVFVQIISEALLISSIAFVISILLVNLFLPLFNTYVEKSMSINLFENIFLFSLVVLVAFLVGISSGTLPAFFLAKMETISLFNLKLSPKSSFNILKKSLVVIQFTISIMMIFATTTIYNQLQYIKSKDLGFNQEQLLIIDINSMYARNGFESIKSEFAKHPSVSSVSVTSRIPGDWKGFREVEARNMGESETDKIKINYIGADKDFLSTYEIQLIEGNNFTGNAQADSLNILINESAAEVLGLGDPVGRTLQLEHRDKMLDYTIAGVMKDFNFRSLHDKVGPLIVGYRINPFQAIDYFTTRFRINNISESLDYFKEVHNNFDKSTPMEFNFLDERIEGFYKQEQKEGILINTASLISILIACLGLFGLASYTGQQRTKEIGIRKVLGASVSEIAFMFSKNFVMLVIISSLIAIPISYYFMQKWLNGFAYRVELGITEILISFITAIVISIITISYQAVKSATSNPVNSIRTE